MINSFPGNDAYMRQFLRPAVGLKKAQLHVETDPPTPTSIKSWNQWLSFGGFKPTMRVKLVNL